MAVLLPSHDVCCVCLQSYPWLARHLSLVIAGSLSDFQTFSCLLSLLNHIENSKYIFTHHSFIFCSIDNIESSSLYLFLWLLSCLLFLLNWIWLFCLVTQMSCFCTWCSWNMQDVYLRLWAPSMAVLVLLPLKPAIWKWIRKPKRGLLGECFLVWCSVYLLYTLCTPSFIPTWLYQSSCVLQLSWLSSPC